MRKITALMLGMVSTLTAGSAWAGVTDNTSLANPPGVYFGTGNANSNFTVDNEGSLEIGLSAIQRFVGPITPLGSTYDVNTGPAGVGHTGSYWGVDFSVNLKGSANLSQITTVFQLQDLGLGTIGSLDARLIPDNAAYNGSTVCQGTIANPCTLGASDAFQNSEALSFSAIAAALGDPGYNMNANDTYLFSLQVFNAAGLSLGTDSITVVAGLGATRGVPEPVTLSLFAAGLAGAAAFGKRRKAKTA